MNSKHTHAGIALAFSSGTINRKLAVSMLTRLHDYSQIEAAAALDGGQFKH